MERRFILERQRPGIEAAKAVGVYAGKGRAKTVPDTEICRHRPQAWRAAHQRLSRTQHEQWIRSRSDRNSEFMKVYTFIS